MATSQSKKFESITLDDVVTAIEILEYYMRISTRAKSVMRQYQNISGGGQTGARGMGSSLSFDDIVNLSVAVEEKKKHKPNGETVGEQLEYEPTPEDISRMKDTVSRVRRKDQDQPNPAISP